MGLSDFLYDRVRKRRKENWVTTSLNKNQILRQKKPRIQWRSNTTDLRYLVEGLKIRTYNEVPSDLQDWLEALEKNDWFSS